MDNDYELKTTLKRIDDSLQKIARIMSAKENKESKEEQEKTQRSLDRYNLFIGGLWGVSIVGLPVIIAMQIWLPR